MFDKDKVYQDTVEIVKSAVASNVNDGTRVNVGDLIKAVYEALLEINNDDGKTPKPKY